jgi:hypothetical protein
MHRGRGGNTRLGIGPKAHQVRPAPLAAPVAGARLDISRFSVVFGEKNIELFQMFRELFRSVVFRDEGLLPHP